jgi:RNA polymerase sigma-70 factor (ECF subfamily)
MNVRPSAREAETGDRTSEYQSFEDFYAEAYSQVLARAVLWCGGHREGAEDAVQEAFAAAAERWADQLCTYDLPEAWVFRIATQRLGKFHRRVARSRDAAASLPVPRASLPEETVEVRAVLSAMKRLPSRQRTCLVLFSLQGMSQDEIARELCIKTAAVASNIHKGRRSLERSLGLRAGYGADREGFAMPTTIAEAGRGRDPLATSLTAAEAWLRTVLAGDLGRGPWIVAATDPAQDVRQGDSS